MSAQANIRDIQVLSDLKAAFGRFGQDVHQILPAFQKQFEEIQEQLEERELRREREVDQARDELQEAKDNLESCQDQVYYKEYNDCSDEEERVAEAERCLVECEEKWERVKQWRYYIESQIADFQNDIHRLSNLVSTRTGPAQAFLDNKIQLLERYVDGIPSGVGTMGLRLDNGKDTIGKEDREVANLKVSLALEGCEEVLAKRVESEKLIALDLQGNILLERTGGKFSVAIFENDRKFLKGSILTHNHPRGLSFSKHDLETSQHFDLAELRAVGVSRPYTYVLKRPENGWPTNIAERYCDILNEVEEEFSLKVERGDMMDETAEQTLAHETMLRLAAELKLNYERRTRT